MRTGRKQKTYKLFHYIYHLTSEKSHWYDIILLKPKETTHSFLFFFSLLFIVFFSLSFFFNNNIHGRRWGFQDQEFLLNRYIDLHTSCERFLFFFFFFSPTNMSGTSKAEFSGPTCPQFLFFPFFHFHSNRGWK